MGLKIGESMSLTSYLTNKENEACIRFQTVIKEVTPSKKEFKALESSYAAFDTQRELKVAYRLENPRQAALVGTAFDYLARFRIAQVVRSNRQEALERIMGNNFFSAFESQLPSTLLKQLKQKHAQAIVLIQKVIEQNMIFDDQVLDGICLFATLEQCFRGAHLPQNIEDLVRPPSPLIRGDLKCLLDVFEKSFIKKVVKPDSIVKYNPTFGIASVVIGGADADIYIDGTLYDFKCIKVLGYRGKDAQQIISYYLLDQVAKKSKEAFFGLSLDKNEINRVAIYSARVGEIYYADIVEMDQSRLQKATEEVEEILFPNKLSQTISNKTLQSKKVQRTKQMGFKRGLGIAVLALMMGVGIGSTINIKEKDSEVKTLPSEKITNIREDYEKKKLQAQEILPKEQGILRYYVALIGYLRAYDVSHLEEAQVVYELSDELLNGMYQDFKIYLSEEDFIRLRAEQRLWVEDKMDIEQEIQNKPLQTYQKLIQFTLDRCEEWTH